MIISHKHKYLFIEIPHTASTAIRVELIENYEGIPILKKHSNYSEFLGIANDNEKKYFVFATVRNPMDDIVSNYCKMVSNHANAFSKPKEFKEHGGWITKEHLEMRKYCSGQHDFVDFFMKFYSNSIFNNWILAGSNKFDYIMRYESLNYDFHEVLKKLKITPVRNLPVINKTSNKGSFEQYFSKSIHISAVRVLGPFMKKWGYEIPLTWNVDKIPLSSRIQFTILDTIVNFLSFYFLMNRQNKFIQTMKKMTSRLGR